MGVPATITVEAPDRESASQGAAAAYARIGEIEGAASDYRPQSEVMRLCREARPGEWRSISSDLARLLSTAREVSARTDGGFDATVGPAVGLWREARQRGMLPGAAALSAARARVNWRAIEVRLDPPEARLLTPGVRIDLGGIAKGYAAQEAGRVLAAHGLARCLVSLSGDVYAGAAPSGERGWRVDVEGARRIGTLWAKQVCISTAGGSQQFVEVEGVRYSHIVDPRTGLGTTTPLCVTAIGADGALVDASDTAAVVVGLERLRRVFVAGSGVTLVVHTEDGPPVIVGDPSRVEWSD